MYSLNAKTTRNLNYLNYLKFKFKFKLYLITRSARVCMCLPVHAKNEKIHCIEISVTQSTGLLCYRTARCD